MPAPGKGRVPIVKVTVTFPAPLYSEIEKLVQSEKGRWLSVVDFVRWSSANEVERIKHSQNSQPARIRRPSP